MSTTLIGSGVNSAADLLELLPRDVAVVIDPETLLEPDFASSLRLLATIRNEGWHRFVRQCTVDWTGLLGWARGEFRTTDNILVRIEIAASLAGHPGSQALLMYGARVLDDANFTALMDALRIARTGVTR